MNSPNMKIGYAALLAVSLLCHAGPARAQQQDAEAWEQVNLVAPVTPRLRITLEEIARFSDRQRGLYDLEFGGLVGWRLSDAIELGVGYRHVGFHGGNSAPDEERLRQQMVLTRGRFSGRLRFDERFAATGGEVGVRFRPLIRYNLPLGPKGVALFVTHESFFNTNDTAWGQRAGYERMRNILGVAFPITRAVSADVGYLNQYRLPRGGARGQMDHVLSVQLTVNLGKLGVAGLHD